MPNTFSNKCVVLWDIVDSSALSVEYGQAEAENIKEKCKNIIQLFMQQYSGSHANDTGDGTYIKFDSPIDAINFTTVSLQYLTKFKAKNSEIPNFRFMLVSDPVIEQDSGNIQGDVATLAARLDKVTEAMCCTLGKSFHEDLMKINKKLGVLFNSIDINIKNVPDKQAFDFDWKGYAQQYGDDTLKGIVDSHLSNAGVGLSSDTINLLDSGVVFWPVVPRRVLTAIHRAQLEVLKVLNFIGWKVHIVIVNVCVKDEYTLDEYSDQFYGKVKEYISRRNFNFGNKVTKLSELFEIEGKRCCDARKLLEKNILRINFATLKDMNDKGYSKDDLKNIGTQPISRHLRPIYTITGLSVISDEFDFSRNLILSGQDESVYWDHMTNDIPHKSIYIPTLGKDQNAQVMQEDEYPIWKSKNAFEQALTRSIDEDVSSNLPTWIRQMFISLPSFVLDDYGANAAKVDKNDLIPTNILVDNVFQLLDLNN